MVEIINNPELGKESTKTSDRLDYQTEIGETVQSLEDFLKSKWVPEDGIAAVWCFYEDELELFAYLWQKWFNFEDIYDKIIKKKIIERYAVSIQKEWLLSKYWINQILECGIEAYIWCVFYRLKNYGSGTWLTEEETRDILKKIHDFYVKWSIELKNTPDDDFHSKDFIKNEIQFAEDHIEVTERLLDDPQLLSQGSEIKWEREFKKSDNDKVIERERLYRVKSMLDSIYTDMSDFEKRFSNNNGDEKEREEKVSQIIDKIQRVTWYGRKSKWELNRDLFLRMIDYPEFYWMLTAYADNFNLEDQDYQELFDRTIKYAKSPFTNKSQWLSRLKEMSEKLDCLNGRSHIDLYISLYPRLSEEDKKDRLLFRRKNKESWETKKNIVDNEILYRLSIISQMDEKEISDFVDWIKNTSYWTVDNCKKIYEVLKEKKYWSIIVDNYVWYFSSMVSKENLFDMVYNSEDKHELLNWLPLFGWIEIDKNKVKELLEYSNQNTIYRMSDCYNTIKRQSTYKKSPKKE